MKAAASHFDLFFADRRLPRAIGRVATLSEHHAEGTPLNARIQNDPKGSMADRKDLIPVGLIESRIFLLRGQKVMLSAHWAELYQVEPRALVQAVKRNTERFPSDFMFRLSAQEFANLKSQLVISSWGGIRRAAPYAFTEQGVAMLSSILRSDRAIHVNIEIMRAFVQLR
jgi:hypothetical protein